MPFCCRSTAGALYRRWDAPRRSALDWVLRVAWSPAMTRRAVEVSAADRGGHKGRRMNLAVVTIATVLVGHTAIVAPDRATACEAILAPAATIVAREGAPAFSWPLTGRVTLDTCS